MFLSEEAPTAFLCNDGHLLFTGKKPQIDEFQGSMTDRALIYVLDAVVARQ